MAKKVSERPRNRPNSDGSVPVTKYYSSGRPLAQKPKKTVLGGHIRIWLSRTANLMVLVLLLVVLGASIIVRPSPKLHVSSLSYRPQGVYERALIKELDNLKNRNKLTFDENSIETSLQKQFPEIRAVNISLGPFSQRPSVKVIISAPVLRLQDGNTIYVMDPYGKLVGQAADQKDAAANLDLISDQSGFRAQLGQEVLSSSQVMFIQTTLAQTRHAGVKIQSISLPPVPAELDIKAADRPYLVKFIMNGDVLIQAGQYLAARHNFDQNNIQPQQYLDVRVQGKIFYK